MNAGMQPRFRDKWNQFWFEPRTAHTLAVIRAFTGAMMAYMHAVWLMRIGDFFGPAALVSRETIQLVHQADFRWSYLWYIDSIPFLIFHELLGVLSGIAFSLGLLVRITGPLAWFLTLMVCHRATGYLFGLDQVVMMLSLYLLVANSSGIWSIDRWLQSRLAIGNATNQRFQWLLQKAGPSEWNTIATRLMQFHLCVVYLFGGIGKLRGEMWWDGSAMWFAFASYEYQSMDATWLGRFPLLLALVTHGTLIWEVFYCALIWPRWSRYWFLAAALIVHSGIAMFMGMITFGFMMIVANMAFLDPDVMLRICQVFQRWRGQASSNTGPQNAPARP